MPLALSDKIDNPFNKMISFKPIATLVYTVDWNKAVPTKQIVTVFHISVHVLSGKAEPVESAPLVPNIENPLTRASSKLTNKTPDEPVSPISIFDSPRRLLKTIQPFPNRDIKRFKRSSQTPPLPRSKCSCFAYLSV